jgi:hypothetical protein
VPHLDELARLATDPRTPRDERWDANAELWNGFASQLDYSNLEEIRDSFYSDLAGGGITAKAMQLAPYTLDSRPPVDHPRFHTSVLRLNEFGLVDSPNLKSRWMEKRSRSGFYLLKDIVQNVDVLGAVLYTRIRQVLRFMRQERDEGPQGFRIVRADGEQVTEAEKPRVRQVEEFVLNCGDTSDYFERQRLQRSDLAGFVTKLVWDTLSGDSCPIELTRTNGGKLSGVHNVDFSTVRLCSEFGYEGRDEVRAVQVIEGIPYVAYGYPDLIYEIRNPRTDISLGGYGCAEPELILRAVTAYLNAVSYNASGIDRNAIPRGILQLIGKYEQGQLDAFKRQTKLMLTGAANRFGIPIIAAEEKGGGAVWVPMDTFDEMFFARWMVFVVSIICAIYGIDPAEIHFDSFNVRGTQLGGKGDTAEKLSLSRDKGLVPLLAFVEKVISIIVQVYDPKYRFRCVGLHEEDEQRKQERIKIASTINEVRAINGQEPHESELIGNAPANSMLMGLYMQEQGIGPMGGDDPDGRPGFDEEDDDNRLRRRKRTGEEDDLGKAVVVIQRNAA